ncbi:hypothetical protein STEG23_018654, partial [Scotinomys teguina]
MYEFGKYQHSGIYKEVPERNEEDEKNTSTFKTFLGLLQVQKGTSTQRNGMVKPTDKQELAKRKLVNIQIVVFYNDVSATRDHFLEMSPTNDKSVLS